MTINEYQEKALRTASGYRSDSLLLNGVMGLCGESGECIDIVKKAMFQGHTLDREHLAEELGDVAWYLAVTAKGLGYDLESIMQRNIDKLAKRYPEGFETERSTHREERQGEA
nr:MAG TPA: NTP-PPase-like protein [Caudoviricetes sp.]